MQGAVTQSEKHCTSRKFPLLSPGHFFSNIRALPSSSWQFMHCSHLISLLQIYSGPREQVRGEVRSPGILGLGIHVGLLRRRQPAQVQRLWLRDNEQPRIEGDIHRGEEGRHPRGKGKWEKIMFSAAATFHLFDSSSTLRCQFIAERLCDISTGGRREPQWNSHSQIYAE